MKYSLEVEKTLIALSDISFSPQAARAQVESSQSSHFFSMSRLIPIVGEVLL